MFVSEIMTVAPVIGKPSWTIGRVVQTMNEGDFRHLPIVDDGNLVGIVSERDLREQLLPALLEYEHRSDAQAMLERSIGEVMQGDVQSVGPETELTELIDLILEQRVGAVPVVDPGTQELVGIVSYIDVLTAARDLF